MKTDDDDLPPIPSLAWRDDPVPTSSSGGPSAATVVRVMAERPWLRSLALALAGVAALVLVVMLARWEAAAARDGWWRDEIARKSTAVREILRTGGADIIEGDATRVDDLEREKNALRDELEILRAARAHTSLSVDCDRCRIPAGRLLAK